MYLLWEKHISHASLGRRLSNHTLEADAWNIYIFWEHRNHNIKELGRERRGWSLSSKPHLGRERPGQETLSSAQRPGGSLYCLCHSQLKVLQNGHVPRAVESWTKEVALHLRSEQCLKMNFLKHQSFQHISAFSCYQPFPCPIPTFFFFWSFF